MAHRPIKNWRAHDSAGYETTYYQFEDLNDGYGNKVAYGDLSMQHLVEAGIRDQPDLERGARRYDTHIWGWVSGLTGNLLGGGESKPPFATEDTRGNGVEPEAVAREATRDISDIAPLYEGQKTKY